MKLLDPNPDDTATRRMSYVAYVVVGWPGR